MGGLYIRDQKQSLSFKWWEVIDQDFGCDRRCLQYHPSEMLVKLLKSLLAPLFFVEKAQGSLLILLTTNKVM